MAGAGGGAEFQELFLHEVFSLKTQEVQSLMINKSETAWVLIYQRKIVFSFIALSYTTFSVSTVAFACGVFSRERCL